MNNPETLATLDT